MAEKVRGWASIAAFICETTMYTRRLASALVRPLPVRHVRRSVEADRDELASWNEYRRKALGEAESARKTRRQHLNAGGVRRIEVLVSENHAASFLEAARIEGDNTIAAWARRKLLSAVSSATPTERELKERLARVALSRLWDEAVLAAEERRRGRGA